MNTRTNALATLATNRKINNLLAQPNLTVTDIADLNNAERQCLEKAATKTLAKLKGDDRDSFLDKIAPIMPAHTKSSLWEHNHAVISSAISNYMRAHGIMPTKSDIAQQTGLSRQTVTSHLQQYRAQPEFVAETEQFKFMSHKLLADIFKHASNGDMKAARLYLEMVGALNKQGTGTVVNAQNNYIQINNTILSQENLKHLSAEQLAQIESIVAHKELKVLA